MRLGGLLAGCVVRAEVVRRGDLACVVWSQDVAVCWPGEMLGVWCYARNQHSLISIQFPVQSAKPHPIIFQGITTVLLPMLQSAVHSRSHFNHKL